MPGSFEFEDGRKPFILMEQIRFFVHAGVGYLKKDVVGEPAASHS